ncbi:hypothetical protein [Mycobacteroides abscessus]|uniref:hypothetical protein n=1 Tax=Mycobacteroides abscessus TaxID=36809 RepID=UPI0003854BD2|nr:hypothetical protein [Mycobacteroides abscessus]EPZ18777.1 hypothetical protein M879_19415 [Mycobacteroides abscessus V06705]MDO3268006.1 hypothetical protein [Mycobacteroides abscessus subsp. abscessus]
MRLPDDGRYLCFRRGGCDLLVCIDVVAAVGRVDLLNDLRLPLKYLRCAEVRFLDDPIFLHQNAIRLVHRLRAR